MELTNITASQYRTQAGPSSDDHSIGLHADRAEQIP